MHKDVKIQRVSYETDENKNSQVDCKNRFQHIQKRGTELTHSNKNNNVHYCIGGIPARNSASIYRRRIPESIWRLLWRTRSTVYNVLYI